MATNFFFKGSERAELLNDLEFAGFDGARYVQPIYFRNGKVAGKVISLAGEKVMLFHLYNKYSPVAYIKESGDIITHKDFEQTPSPDFITTCDSFLADCAIRAYEDCDCSLDYLPDWEGVSYA